MQLNTKPPHNLFVYNPTQFNTTQNKITNTKQNIKKHSHDTITHHKEDLTDNQKL